MPRSTTVVLALLVVLALFAAAVFALGGASDDATAASGQSSSEPSEPGVDTPSSSPSAGAAAQSGGLSQQQLVQCIVPGTASPQEMVGTRDVPDASAEEQIGDISDVVAELRDLRFDDPPDPQFLNDDQITERIETDIREETDVQDVDVDTRLLAALGAITRDTDLLETQVDLLGAQVAGFYDPDTGELVVRTGDTAEGLDAPTQSVLAHELEHAVADQRLELPVDVTEDISESDAGLAALSVIEGDASLIQQQFTVVGLSRAEQLEVFEDPQVAAAQEQLEGVPHYLARSLEFPYVDGLEFVCTQFLEGGWAAVDAVYDALPTSSVEIMDPSRYPFDVVDPRDPGGLGDDWTRARATTLGAADLQWLFEAPGDDTEQALDDPRAAALEWTGGELTAWTKGDDTAVGVALTQRTDDGPLCDAMVTWYERAFPDADDVPPRSGERLVREGPDQTAVVTCAGDTVRLGIGPDRSIARTLVGS